MYMDTNKRACVLAGQPLNKTNPVFNPAQELANTSFDREISVHV